MNTFFLELFPLLEYWTDQQQRHWFEIAESTGEYREESTTLSTGFDAISNFNADSSLLRTLEARLTQEHQRLDIVERKAQVILGSTSLMLGLAGPLLPSSSGNLGSIRIVLAGLTLLMLTSGVLLGLHATRVGVRYYVEPHDIKRIGAEWQGKTPSEIIGATSFAFAAFMADKTNTKLRAVDVAQRSLRNAILLLTALTLMRVCFT